MTAPDRGATHQIPLASTGSSTHDAWYPARRAVLDPERTPYHGYLAFPSASGAQCARCAELRWRRGGQLSFIDHDIPQHHFRIGFELGGWRQQLYNQQILCCRTVQGWIRVVVWIVLEIHLRDEPVLPACYLEVDVGGSEPVGSGRIGPPGFIVLKRYRPSWSVVRTAEPSKFGSSGTGLVSLGCE